MLAKLTSGGQVSLPRQIRTRTGVEPGDFFEIELNDDGNIVLKPKKLVDAGQAYFWTEEWQKGERQADADIKAGRVKRFKSAADALRYLEAKG